MTCINLHLRVFPGTRATPGSWYILRFPASCFGQISQGGAGGPIRWIWSISHHRSCADACVAKRDNVWLVNGSSDRDKEWHALDMYQSASAGIPWSPGDACKLVYSSFPCVLFWPNFTRRRRRSHQIDLVYLAPSQLCRCMCG